MNPVLIIDHREREILRHLRGGNVDVKESALPVGDAILSDRVGVERKRISDFLQSIVDQRIFSQCDRMIQAFEQPLIILEGNPELLFLERNIHKNTIRGVLASIAIDYKIPILWTQNTEETAGQLVWIATREQFKKSREPQIRGARKTPTLQDQQEYLIAGIPGINTKRARRLLEHFKTPEGIFQASEKELLAIKGFGKKTAERLRALMKEPYSGQ